jgi:predicted negative regulator of RcsB-dependent stress response
MARHLDLEEQEQLDELKHFWNQYGNLITWVLIVVFGAIAAWNGWHWWQRQQAGQASALYDEVERSVQAGDLARVERAVADIRDKFGRTTYAQQAALLGAKAFVDKGKPDAAREALAWVADKSGDEGYRAVARLRLAGLLIDAKNYDEALKQLSGDFPGAFQALAADRRGDIYSLQGKKAEAKAEYTKAYQGLEDRSEYRRLVEVKLNALGVDPQSLQPAAAPASAPAKS